MEPETTKEYLKCILTPDEMKMEAEKMANGFSKLSELEGTLKSAKKQIESDIAKVEAEVSLAVEKYRSGFEMRNVECLVIKTFELNTVYIKRLDTGEIIRERPMSLEERQGMLDLKEKEDEPTVVETAPEE